MKQKGIIQKKIITESTKYNITKTKKKAKVSQERMMIFASLLFFFSLFIHSFFSHYICSSLHQINITHTHTHFIYIAKII